MLMLGHHAQFSKDGEMEKIKLEMVREMTKMLIKEAKKYW
jgi:hypothetical protein